MRTHSAKRLAFASIFFGHGSRAAPVADEAHEEVNVYDVFPIEVVIAKPTAVEFYCSENGVYPVADDFTVTVTDAPTTVSTETTKYSTLRTQTTV